MFKNLLQFWKGKDFLNQVFEKFQNMLDDAQIMFEAVCKRLVHNEKQPGLTDRVYAIDKKINEIQKDIRKRVIEHLSLQCTADISTCLLLMSVVKDAERLGDYAKNLLQLDNLLNKPVNVQKYKSLFNNLEVEIIDLFKKTKDAFIESDEDKAAQTWDYQRQIKKKCDGILKKLVKSDLSADEAVCFALMARYLKRITSHLTNIATSVILPLTDLDYFDEKRREDDENI